MLRLSHRRLIIAAGLIWLAAGLFLLCLGFQRLSLAAAMALEGANAPVLDFLSSHFGSESLGLLCLLFAALTVGFIKGRTVMTKSMRRTVARIRTLPDPSPFSKLYGWKYLVLLALMMGLGVAMRLLAVPLEVRGAVLVAVGSGLTNSSVVAFRSLSELKRAKT